LCFRIKLQAERKTVPYSGFLILVPKLCLGTFLLSSFNAACGKRTSRLQGQENDVAEPQGDKTTKQKNVGIITNRPGERPASAFRTIGIIRRYYFRTIGIIRRYYLLVPCSRAAVFWV
jgi:hypothetical protein